MALDGPHLGEVQRKLARLAELVERRVVHPRIGHFDPAELVRLPLAEWSNGNVPDDRLLDGVVGEDPLDQPGEAAAGRRRGKCGSSGRSRRANPRSRSTAGAFGLGVGDAGLGQDVDDRLPARLPVGSPAGRTVTASTTGSTQHRLRPPGGRRCRSDPPRSGSRGSRRSTRAGDAEFGGVGGDSPALAVDSGRRRAESAGARAWSGVTVRARAGAVRVAAGASCSVGQRPGGRRAVAGGRRGGRRTSSSDQVPPSDDARGGRMTGGLPRQAGVMRGFTRSKTSSSSSTSRTGPGPRVNIHHRINAHAGRSDERVSRILA